MHEVKPGDESVLMSSLITGSPAHRLTGPPAHRVGPGGPVTSPAPGVPQHLQQLTCRPSSHMTAAGIRNADSPVYRPKEGRKPSDMTLI